MSTNHINTNIILSAPSKISQSVHVECRLAEVRNNWLYQKYKMRLFWERTLGRTLLVGVQKCAVIPRQWWQQSGGQFYHNNKAVAYPHWCGHAHRVQVDCFISIVFFCHCPANRQRKTERARCVWYSTASWQPMPPWTHTHTHTPQSPYIVHWPQGNCRHSW